MQLPVQGKPLDPRYGKRVSLDWWDKICAVYEFSRLDLLFAVNEHQLCR